MAGRSPSTPLRTRGHDRGFSLLELLIALVLGLFVLGALIQTFSAFRQSSRLVDAQAQVQEASRFAAETLARSMRAAGDLGCVGVDNLENQTTEDSLLEPLAGADNVGPYDLPGSAKIGPSDNVTITRMLSPPMRLADNVTSTDNLKVEVVEPNALETGPLPPVLPGQLEENLAVITDCSDADLFQITSSNPAAGDWTRTCGSTNVATSINQNCGASANVPLSAEYNQTNTIVRVVRQDTFSIDDLTGGPHLARVRNPFFPGNINQAMIPNVVDMQVFYGIGGADGVADSYVPAGGVGDFADVVSLRIFLLIRSREDNVVDQPQSLRYIDASSANQDLATLTMPTRHFYRVVVQTISRRDRS